jgi:tetratricopeptide (TPR) repeat protein
MDAGNDSAETYRRGGIVAYEDRRLDEAAELFGKAVAIDRDSAEAHLALGAARLTEYIRGCRPPSTDYVFGNHEVSEADWYAYEEERSAFIAQQNATNWPLAEKSLKKANQLDPQNKLIVQYICVLYSFWKDPLTEENGRADEAICWLERLAELDPTDYDPNLSCATLLTMEARKLLPNYGRFPAFPEPVHGEFIKLRSDRSFVQPSTMRSPTVRVEAYRKAGSVRNWFGYAPSQSRVYRWLL